jgi:DNA-binding SARP family transcriptional activator
MSSPFAGAPDLPSGHVRSVPEPLWFRVMGELALYPHRYETAPIMTAGKPLALLAYLALATEGTADRDYLRELLWPDSDSSARHHSLRQCRYRLRALTGSDLVVQEGSNLRLCASLAFDCLEGERASEPTASWRLLEGNFLAGFAIPESREFEEWAESQRSRFRERRVWAGLELARAARDRGDAAGTLEIAEHLARIRPFDDEPVLLALHALSASGRVASALSRYAAYVDALAAEEYEPGEELASYAAELRRLARERSEAPRQELPFVGRCKEWSALERLWEDAAAGRGGAVLIEGGAGLGKSRLTREVHARVRAAGGVVLAAKSYEPEVAVPYAAITDALAPAVADPATLSLPAPWLAELSKLLPEIRERQINLPHPPSGRGSPAAKRRLHQALLRLLAAISARTPALLTIDDVHWADSASMEVLHFLARNVTRSRVLILLTYRPAELGPDSRRLTRSLAAQRLAELIVLEPLTQEDVRDLLCRTAAFENVDLPETFGRHLHRISGGNPLFLEEILDALSRQGILRVRDGKWIWDSEDPKPHLPRTVGKLLADRIDVLDSGTRACLELSAVVADDVPAELVTRALSLSEPRAELALLILEDNRLIRRIETGGFAISHDELRRLVYQMIPDDRRRTLHRLVAETLEASGESSRPGGSARLAFHFEQGAVRGKAQRYALAAAEDAARLSAEDQGRSQLRAAAALADLPLAPGQVSTEPRARVRSRRIAVAALAITAIASASSLMYWASGDHPDHRQGTLYLGTTAGERAARIEWTRDGGRVRQVNAESSLAPGTLINRPVSADGETHNKIFLVGDGTVTQLTTGSADDGPAVWAPDRRSIFLVRGWKATAESYVVNVFRLDAHGRIQAQLTRTSGQDTWVEVSPRGTAIAVVRDSAGISSILLMDADGNNVWNLSETLVLPRVRAFPRFSPDGSQLAFAYGGAVGELFVFDVSRRHARKIGSFDGLSVYPSVVWSPDGRWIAVVRAPEGNAVLTLVSVDGSGAVVEIGGILPDLVPASWEGATTRFVDRIELLPQRLTLSTGEGHGLKWEVRDVEGEPIENEPVRFSVGDTSIARADGGGYVLGRSPGTTSLIASVGGFRADTITVNVAYAAVDTLFYESWTRGLDTLVWEPFGSPRPRVVGTGMLERPDAFLNNGDYNHGSGVVSIPRFDASAQGLTVQAEGWIPLTYDHWQHWQVGVVAGKTPYFGDREFHEFTGVVAIDGDTPVYGHPRWVCRGTGGGVTDGPWDPVEDWVRFSLQVRPDGRIECLQDSRLLGSVQLPSSVPLDSLAIVLRGHTVGTNIYHGRVVVTSGLRR